jgi:hypothetical protein
MKLFQNNRAKNLSQDTLVDDHNDDLFIFIVRILACLEGRIRIFFIDGAESVFAFVSIILILVPLRVEVT